MIVVRWLFVCVVFVVTANQRAAAEPYSANKRIEYLGMVLQSFAQMDQASIENIQDHVDMLNRSTCSSRYLGLKIGCLLKAARNNCRQIKGRPAVINGCRFVSDVVVTNKLSEDMFVDTQTKYKLMRNNKNYRSAYRSLLRRKHAILATKFSLSDVFNEYEDNLPIALDSFCVRMAQTRSLSWHYCISAITWFIGTSQHEATSTTMDARP